MATTSHGIYEGFDGTATDWICTTTSGTSRYTTNQHPDLNGIFPIAGVSGACQLNNTVFSSIEFKSRRSDINWEEFVVEWWWRVNDPVGNAPDPELRFNDTGSTKTRVTVGSTSNTIQHEVLSTSQGNTTISNMTTDGRWIQHHQLQDASVGYMRTFVDNILELEHTGLNTLQSGNGINEFVFAAGSFTHCQIDDLAIRPRTILVTGVTSADTATPTAITGGTGGETANVYAWENDSQDSAGGSGDPTLAAGEWRLFLRDLSFGPEETGATGFVDTESITVTGLTGTIICNAPHSGYKKGLEPGSMFFGQGLHIVERAITGTGTENTDGTLQGGATDRADALAIEDGTEKIRHTAASESVTVAIDPFDAGEEAVINEIVGLQLSVVGLTSGGTPDTLTPRVLDNAASAQTGIAKQVGSVNTKCINFFPDNGSGGQWVTGTGAGGIDSAEVGYETS